MVSKTKQDSLTNSVLIGRCDCDDVVKFPFYWCEEVIKEAEKLGFNVIDLKRENFIEDKFNKLIVVHNPNFIFLNGHGDEYCAMGFRRTPVITINKNDYLLKDKIAHIISCKTAACLGYFAIDKGCKGYIGYNGIFGLWSINSNPVEDKISKIFMEAVNIVSITLLNGGTLEEAYNNSQKVYNNYIELLMKRLFKQDDGDIKREYLFDILTVLKNNKKNQIFISNNER